jgi:hypothetical protein
MKVKFLIRLITLFTYFLPFAFFHTTCVGSEYRIAYNKEEAAKNEAEAQELENSKENTDVKDTVKKTQSPDTIISTQKSVNELESSPKESTGTLSKTEWQSYLITPTKESLSAPGCMFFYKNIIGSICIGASAIFTVFTLILWKFIKRKKIFIHVDTMNLICITAFLVDSLILKIDLLWGFWLLFILLLTQLFMEIYDRKKNV